MALIESSSKSEGEQIAILLKKTEVWTYGVTATIFYWPISQSGRFEGVLYDRDDYLTLNLYEKNLVEVLGEGAKLDGNENYTLVKFTWVDNKYIKTTNINDLEYLIYELDEVDIEQLNSYSVPAIVINNKIEGEQVGCITFGYEHNLRKIIAEKLNIDKEITPVFVHVHNCGRLLARTEKAFIEVCKELNRDYEVFNVDDSYTRTYDDFLSYFKTHKQGYFIAYRDSIAAAIMNAATDSGMKIPENVEVLSLIGTKYAKILRPTVTCMTIDMTDVGRRSMYMLIDLMKKELEQKRYRVEAVYEKRDSTKE